MLIGSTYLILKTEGELQTTHNLTAKISAVTTFIGAVYLTVTTPIFSESARNKLFDAPLVYVFALIPLLGALLIFLLLKSLYSNQER